MHSKSREFTGTGTALITPFKRDGTIDEEALRRLVDFQEENGVDMLLPCGSTGEAACLGREEHLQVIEIVIDQAKRAKVVAGAGSNCTREAIDLSMEAADMGADAILSISPYYNKPTQEGIVKHYEAIAEAAGVPVIVYNVPGRTGLNITAETEARLADIPNIVGVKEASGDLGQVKAVIDNKKEDFVVLSGDDSMTYDVMGAGGDGVFSVVSNCCPKEVSQMVDFLKDGEMGKAKEIHERMLPLFKGVFCESNPIPIKYIMSRMGFGVDFLRLPLTPISDKGRATLDPILEQYGL
ncbi:4-hydroxy-tetrahydrodipicolinate synthase [Methanomethylophilus alvi]|uniref:4-hydroxy-tetrahydrodipicolinate synthase n=1 Tax=Methanomethylophilus alvi TaxID=1291540 RepID=UPI0037DD255C